MAEPAVRVTEVAALDGLPPAALALFGQDAFSTLAWYRTIVAAALPAGAVAAFQVASAGGRVLGVFPMMRRGRGLAALSTFYTCLWRPLLAHEATQAELVAVGRALAPIWRRAGVVRLDAMPAGDLALSAVLAGLRAAGMPALTYDHFGNWHEDVAGRSWESYLASRETRLRSAIRRQTRRAERQPGFAFDLVRHEAGLEEAIAAYEAVYEASWKEPEPYPDFNAMLMRACAADGSLRLGVLRLGKAAVAAQFWLVQGGWAGVLKLAYDEAYKAFAPGNVLTGLMVRHVLEQDGVLEIDFGRGDDAYKAMWAVARRQRVGALVVNPFHPLGAAEMVRHWGGRGWRKASSPF